jgi:hypothetical protein
MSLCIHIRGTLLPLRKAVTPAMNVIKIFNFVCILEINVTEEVISNTTCVSKQLGILKNKFKRRINKNPGETSQ